MSADVVSKNKKYKLVPPDGGWGYAICVAFVIHCSGLTMFLGCFGMLYGDFMKEINFTSTGVTTLGGVQATCASLAGFFTASFLKILSVRKLTLISSLIQITGNLGMVFANSPILFILFQGVMQGTSVGLTFNLTCTIMNDYFVKKRLFAFSVVQTFVATSAMVGPVFVRWALDQYGFRGTLILIAGINLHTILAVVLMHPVKWHMKKIEIPDESEMQILLVDEKNKAVVAVDKSADTKPDLTNVEQKITEEPVENEKSNIMKFINSIIDVKLFKKFFLTSGCLGMSLATFVDTTYTMIFPQALYANGWAQNDVAFAITLYSFGDLIMRTMLVFLSNWLFKIGSQALYIVGIVIGIVARLGLLWSHNQIVIYAFIVLIGVSKCFALVLITIVVSEYVPSEKFTQAMGIFLLVSGGIGLIFGPVVGFIRDLTNSYATAFYVLISILVTVVLFWSIELCYKKNKQKRKEYAEKMRKIKK